MTEADCFQNWPIGRPTCIGNAAASLAVILPGIPAGITSEKFEGSRIACHSFELAAECAAAS